MRFRVLLTLLGMNCASVLADGHLDPIRAAVDHGARPEADRVLDEKRKPLQVLSFFGLHKDMKVLDVFAGGGYYAELISRVVAGDGEVVLYNNDPWNRFVGETVTEWLAGDRLANVKSLVANPSDLAFDNEFDAAVFVLGMHDIYYADPDDGWPQIDVSSFLAAIFKSLKPGGVLGIVDHNALAGADPAESGKTLHRIDPEVIKKDLLQAGFVFEDRVGCVGEPGRHEERLSIWRGYSLADRSISDAISQGKIIGLYL